MPNMREIEAQAKALAPVFSRLLERANSALREELKQQIAERDGRIADLEKMLSDRPGIDEIAKQAAELIPTSKDDKKCKDADIEAIKSQIECLIAALPSQQNSQSVTFDDVRPLLAELVDEAVKSIPPAAPGKDADMETIRAHLKELVDAIPPAKDGLSVTADDVLPALKEHADAFLRSLPVPKDGKPGKDAIAPTAEEIAATFERRYSDLVLAWERQARETFDKAAERMPIPKDGENGRDALALEAFEMSIGEDGRTVTVKMQTGETVLEKSVKIAALIDRGVFSKGSSYERGDGTTYGGCYWIAQKDAPDGVPGGSTDWRLAVKKGRDGKDLRESSSKHDHSKGVPTQ